MASKSSIDSHYLVIEKYEAIQWLNKIPVLEKVVQEILMS